MKISFIHRSLNLSVSKIIKEKIDFYSHLIQEKEIEVIMDIKDEQIISMDTYLADSLFLNLIKNSIMHNEQKGIIKIDFDGEILNIQNSGSKLNFDGDIFKRFVRSSNKDSLGIGLSIVKEFAIFIQY